MVFDFLTQFLQKLRYLNALKEAPGFIIVSYDYKKVGAFERDIFIPETFIIEVENYLTEHKETDIKTLYGIGKTFTWNYWKMLNVIPVPTLEESRKYVKEFLQYLKVAYCSDAKYEIIREGIISIKYKNLMICSKNGKGFLTSGFIAGSFASFLNKKDVECVKLRCEGRGDEYCEFLVGFPDLLVTASKNQLVRFVDIQDYKINDEKYHLLNEIRNVGNLYSIKDLQRMGFASYTPGSFLLGDRRILPFEITFLHLIEGVIDKEIVFDKAKAVGIDIGVSLHLDDASKACNIVSALGYGGISYFRIGDEARVKITNYPYSCCIKNLSFPYICGLLSGVLSASTGKEYHFTLEKYSFTEDGLALLLKSRVG